MNRYGFILAPLLGWLGAQGIKFVVSLRKDGIQFKDLYSSGGFPSSHTASTVALATTVGFVEGFTSSIFAVAAIFTGIVMYDSAGVRRSTGEHTLLLKKLTKDNKTLSSDRDRLHVFLGHTPREVAGGILLGAIIGYFVASAML